MAACGSGGSVSNPAAAGGWHVATSDDADDHAHDGPLRHGCASSQKHLWSGACRLLTADLGDNNPGEHSDHLVAQHGAGRRW